MLPHKTRGFVACALPLCTVIDLTLLQILFFFMMVFWELLRDGGQQHTIARQGFTRGASRSRGAEWWVSWQGPVAAFRVRPSDFDLR